MQNQASLPSMKKSIADTEREIQEIPDERQRIDRYNALSWHLRDSDLRQAIRLASEALRIAQKLPNGEVYEQGLAESNLNLGFFHYLASQYEEALIRLLQARKLFEKNTNSAGLAKAHLRMGLVYWGIGEFDKALGFVFQSIGIFSKSEKDPEMAWGYFTLGAFYYDLKDYEFALSYYEKALLLFYETNHKTGIARCKNGIGKVYEALRNYEKALQAHDTAYRLQQEMQDLNGMANALNDIGNVYTEVQIFDKALRFYQESLRLRRKSANKQGAISTLLSLGKLYFKMKESAKALQYLKKALEQAQEINAKPKLYLIHEALAEVYKALKEPWLALEHYEQFLNIRKAILGEEANTRLKNLQTSLAVEKAEKEAEIYKISNQKLQKAYKEIEQKNQQITDSIRYAKRIQEAIIPDKAYLKQFLPDSFVFYEPKDIVSGDFYWCSSLRQGQDFILAVIDCTGHGVPGAFMTVLANTLLHQIVNEAQIYAPARILQILDQKVSAMLQQYGASQHSHQGMDIALCHVQPQAQMLHFAGAKRPLYYVENGQMQMIRGNIFPVGASQYKEGIVFQEHALALREGQVFYLFTDGYQDQFGAQAERKLMQKNFRDLLLSISDLPLEAQAEYLQNYLFAWKGHLEQTDDILVLGFSWKNLPMS